MENEKNECFDMDKMPDDAPIIYCFDFSKHMDEDGNMYLPPCDSASGKQTKIDTLPGAADLTEPFLAVGSEFETNKTSFVVGGEEIIGLHQNGDIYVKGKLVENDKEVVDALREFLQGMK